MKPETLRYLEQLRRYLSWDRKLWLGRRQHFPNFPAADRLRQGGFELARHNLRQTQE